jgi:Tfp pilus assembly protein PilF
MKDSDAEELGIVESHETSRTSGFNARDPPNRRQLRQMGDATKYFQKKLDKDPNMARYNHCLAAIYSEVGDTKSADAFFKNSIANAPDNVMTRNDYALHLSRLGYTSEAVDELNKAMLATRDQPVLRKNLGAVLARNGQYTLAHEHTKRSLDLAPNSAMTHRNMARIKDAMGDSDQALKHNRIALQLDSGNGRGHCAAHRAAAVQIVTRGGDHSEALALMDRARQLEGREFVLPTTQRTKEVINMIVRRSGDKKAEIEKAKADAEAKKEAEAALLNRKYKGGVAADA